MSFRDAEIEGLAEAAAPHLITEVPGPNAQAVLDRDARTTSPSRPRAYPLVPKRGAGSVIEDVDGNRFLDLNAGIAVTSTGHCHPKVVEAIQRQAAELIHYSASDFFLPIYSELTEKLDEIAPMKGRTRSFLTNSGTEAVEAARAVGLEVALVGGRGRFEIWNLQRWKKAHEDETATYQHVANVIGL